MPSRIHHIIDDGLGNTSYLLETGQRSAVVVDPRRDVDEHLALAEKLGLRIVGVLETHLHADFVGGAREIAQATGAEIYAAAGAHIGFAHNPVGSGSRLVFGDVEIEVLATPGHTPEHISYLATIGERRALFSGGSLIVGGAARTDLTGPERTGELARAQFASLRLLAALPDDVLLNPTHGAGSFCSTGPARSASSTIGAERAQNALFRITDETQFVEHLVAGFGTYPRYFAHLREVNRAGAPLLDTLPPVRELPAHDAHGAVTSGAWLIDGRGVEEWARAHPVASVSIAVRPGFASWLGWVVPFNAPVVLVLDAAQVPDALSQARRIGYDRALGWLTFEEWRSAGLPVSSIETVAAEQVSERRDRGVLLLDVRQHDEFAAGRIPGATHIELGDIIAGKTPEASEVLTYCGHGERSSTAASLLARRGIHVANLRGGTSGWRRAGLALDS